MPLCVPSPQIEGLHEDIDFRTKVTRTVVEELSSDLLERVKWPMTQALEAADMTMVNMVVIVLYLYC